VGYKIVNELIDLLKSDANAANAFGALASAVAAMLALFVSVVSVLISVQAARVQRKHNELSVRPIAEVTVGDYEHSLRVKIRNNGTGPMLVHSVTISNGVDTKKRLIDWMPPLPHGRLWTNFSHTLRHRTIQAGAEITLLELTEFDGEQNFAKCRDIVRKALSPLTVKVEYSDIYDSLMRPHIKPMSWFGRHF
jgi:hypothetical protein